jgi:glycosyltransferase involved in cell wall biosynthesis
MTCPNSVSVICTFLNAAPTIEATLKSMCEQTAAQAQFIVVDDGSADRSSEIVRKYAAADPRFLLVTNVAPGRIRALNLGVRMAEAEFIAILDADDIAHPAWLENGIVAMRRKLEFSVIGYDRLLLHGAAAVPAWNRDESAEPSVRNVTRLLARGNQISHSGAFIRKTHLADLGYYDETLAYLEDYDLWVRFAAAGYQIGRSELVRIAKRYHAGQKFSSRRGHSLASFAIQYRAAMAIDRNYYALTWLGLRACRETARAFGRLIKRNPL